MSDREAELNREIENLKQQLAAKEDEFSKCSNGEAADQRVVPAENLPG